LKGAEGVVETQITGLAAQAGRSRRGIPTPGCRLRQFAIRKVAAISVCKGDNEEKSDQDDRADGGHDGLVGVDSGLLRFLGRGRKAHHQADGYFLACRKKLGRGLPSLGDLPQAT
jgi:hypothetical protein